MMLHKGSKIIALQIQEQCSIYANTYYYNEDRISLTKQIPTKEIQFHCSLTIPIDNIGGLRPKHIQLRNVIFKPLLLNKYIFFLGGNSPASYY